MDFRAWAGHDVIVGETEGSYAERHHEQRRLYFLAVLESGTDLPAHVKAIIEDDAHEPSEILWVAHVGPDGRCKRLNPLVVLDEQNRLMYGHDFLTAVKELGIGAQAFVIGGVKFE